MDRFEWDPASTLIHNRATTDRQIPQARTAAPVGSGRHSEFLFNVFGSLAQFERALITDRVNAGLAAAKRRGRIGGRPRSPDKEQIKQIVAALDGGASKASVCRTFKMPRATLLNKLDRIGWKGMGVGQGGPQTKTRTPVKLAKANVA